MCKGLFEEDKSFAILMPVSITSEIGTYGGGGYLSKTLPSTY
jgi:hypothetical protein